MKIKSLEGKDVGDWRDSAQTAMKRIKYAISQLSIDCVVGF